VNIEGARVLVTGGAGFIGSHVVDQLVGRGCEVVVIDDLSTGSRRNLDQHEGDPRVRLEIADIRDAEAMHRLVRDANVVIHMAVASLRASLSEPMMVHEVNATGTLNVCAAAQANGVGRLVYVSSSEAYGSAAYAPMDEGHPLDPTTVYGASKAAGELYATAYLHTYGLETTVVRPFNSYGPREHAEGTSAEVIPRFVMRVLAGEPPVIFGDGEQTRDFTWVEETAHGIIEAASSDALVGRHVNIARGQEVSIRRIAEFILDLLERPELGIIHDHDRPGDVMRHFADVSRASQELGFEATVDIAEGLQRYIGWVTAQQPDAAAWAQRELARNW
jgi:UDP-glucose 4-epimerase